MIGSPATASGQGGEGCSITGLGLLSPCRGQGGLITRMDCHLWGGWKSETKVLASSETSILDL